MKRTFASRHAKGIARLSDGCNTDTGQCLLLALMTEAEANILASKGYIYLNEVSDPDQKFSFKGDYHPMHGDYTFADAVAYLEDVRIKTQTQGPSV